MNSVRIEWSAAYEIGIEDIDFQHHYFLNLINRLSAELAASDNPEYRLALIAELNAYARFHFLSEENMMKRNAYPLLGEHRQHHLQLIDQLSHRQASLVMNQSENEALGILEFLLDWFLTHTIKEDRLFADYLLGRDSNAISGATAPPAI